MVLETLFQFWVAQGQERHLLELPGKDEQPQAAQRQRSGKIPRGRNSAVGEVRTGGPEQIDQTHENQPNGNQRQRLDVALEVARQQQEKWHKETENQNDDGHHTPFAVQAGAIKRDFLRGGGGPDDQQLGNGEKN